MDPSCASEPLWRHHDDDMDTLNSPWGPHGNMMAHWTHHGHAMVTPWAQRGASGPA